METLYTIIGMVAAFMCGVWAAKRPQEAHKRDFEPVKVDRPLPAKDMLSLTKELEDAIRENQEATIEQIKQDTERLRQYNDAMSYSGKAKEVPVYEPVDD